LQRLAWVGGQLAGEHTTGTCWTSTFLNRRARGGHGFRHWSFLKQLIIGKAMTAQ
jgi:hypothetical protein